MALKNIVTAGDYLDGRVEAGWSKIHITGKNGFGKKAIISKETVESYEIIDKNSKTSGTSAVARGAIGAALLGPVGLAAALSAKKKGVHTMAIQFKDGKRSLLEVDDTLFKAIQKALF